MGNQVKERIRRYEEIIFSLKNIFEISFKLPGEAFAFVVMYKLFAKLSEEDDGEGC